MMPTRSADLRLRPDAKLVCNRILDMGADLEPQSSHPGFLLQLEALQRPPVSTTMLTVEHDISDTLLAPVLCRDARPFPQHDAKNDS